MNKLFLLLLIGNTLFSQTTCETKDELKDLNVISLKKCFKDGIENDSNKRIRKGQSKTSSKRYLTVRRPTKVVRQKNKKEISGIQEYINSYGLVSKKVNNIKIDSSLVFSEKFKVIESFKTVDVIPSFKKNKKGKTKEQMRLSFYNEITDFISNNIIYPEEAINKGVNGEVKIKFVINIQGDISSVMVTGDEKLIILKEEVIGLINQLPKLEPGIKNNKKVPVKFEFSLNFTL